jgi:hypothetical protein
LGWFSNLCNLVYGTFGIYNMKYTITFQQLRNLVERDVGHPVNVCLLWGNTPITTKSGYFEKANYRKLRWIDKKSTKLKPSPRDCGQTLTVNDIPKLIQHYVKLKEIPFGEYTVTT